MADFQELRELVCAANLDLVGRGLVICTWGNVSAIDRDAGVVAIKPSGIRYDQLTPAEIVLVDVADHQVVGNLRPSSDLPTHLVLYAAFPEAGGIAHTHSSCATAFAQASRPVPCLGTTHADHFFGSVPVTRKLRADETSRNYESNTGRVIVEAFRGLDPAAIPAVLVADHGPFTWGKSAAEAVVNSAVLEAVARMARDTLLLAPDSEPVAAHLLARHFRRKHGPSAYYGQDEP